MGAKEANCAMNGLAVLMNSEKNVLNVEICFASSWKGPGCKMK
jgi:hypothetical protein